MSDDAKACACVVKCLFRGGDAACFRAATAWRRNIFYGKTLHSLRWQPETNGCVSATDSVKMRLRILTSCKNRVKTSYKQEEGRKRQRVKETKRGRDEESKRLRDKESKSQRDKESKRQGVKETKSQRDKESKRQRVKETRSQREEESRSQRDKESKRGRDKERKRRRDERRKPFLCATEGRDICHLTAQPCCGKIECAEGKVVSSLVKTLLA